MKYSSLSNQSLFWDTNPNKIDKELHKEYIISRILESGSIKDIAWLKKNYSNDELKEVISTTGRISQKTALFWKNILNITKEIRCLSDQYQQIQNKHWIR